MGCAPKAEPGNLHDSYPMLGESELDQLPFSVFGGSMARNDDDYPYCANGDLTEECDKGTGKQVQIELWSERPADFSAGG